MKVSIANGLMGVVGSLKAEEWALPESVEAKKELLKEKLFGWANEFGVTGAVLGLELKEFSHNVITLPLKSSEDIRRALPFEMEKYLPLPTSEYVFDFVKTGHSKEGSTLLVLSLRIANLRWFFDTLAESGIKLLGVRCAFLEAIAEFVSKEKLNEVFFYYGHDDSFSLSGIKDSAPSYLRTVTRKELFQDIDKNRESFGKGIYTIGSHANSEASELSAKTLPYSLPYLIAESAFKRGKMSLDFTPEEFAVKRFDFYPYAIGLMSIVSIILYISTGLVAYGKDKNALAEVDASLNRIKSTAGGLIESKKELEAVEKQKDFLTKFKADSNLPVGALRTLSNLIPPDAYLTDFSSDETGKVEIKGYAQKASLLIEPIEKSKLFKKVEFSSPTTSKDNLQRFSLKMEVER